MNNTALRLQRYSAIRWSMPLLAVTIAWASAASARAEAPFFMGLGSLFPHASGVPQLEYDVSADGSVVVGTETGIGSVSAFRWIRDTGMVDLGFTDVGRPRVSADGSTIINAGNVVSGTALISAPPFRWTEAMGSVLLPLGQADGISGDGSAVVGHIDRTAYLGSRAVRWTESGGVEPIFDDLVNLPLDSLSAWDTSADGSVILGSRYDWGGASHLFVWSAADGYNFVGPPDGPDVPATTSFVSISDDGSTVAAAFGVGGAFRWTKATGIVALGTLPDGVPTRSARGLSADGSVIVGNSASVAGQQKACIWDEAHGSRYLLDVLVNEAGLGNALAGWSLGVALGLSGDGRHIVGFGTNPAGNTEGWIAYLGTPVSGDFNHNGTVDAADYVVWRKGLGAAYTLDDYNAWRSGFGQSAGIGIGASANAAVPEPAILAFLMFAAAGICLKRSRAT